MRSSCAASRALPSSVCCIFSVNIFRHACVWVPPSRALPYCLMYRHCAQFSSKWSYFLRSDMLILRRLDAVGLASSAVGPWVVAGASNFCLEARA